MALHPAVEGFDRSAESYERGRPGYPDDALAFLHDALNVRPGDRVLELGAGTGKFTRAMRPWSVRGLALEPVRGMRTVFRRESPGAELVVGRAESLPLRPGTFKAVVAAQSFHWFRQPETLREILRVLRATGGLGLLWNRRDESVPWVARLSALIDGEMGDVPRTRSETWKGVFEEVPGFRPLEARTFAHVDPLPPDRVVDRILSISAIGLLPRPRQEELARGVRGILEGEPALAGRDRVPFPYRTEAFVALRSHGSP